MSFRRAALPSADHIVVILPNTPAAATLTPADVEKRTNSFNARRALLRTNPALFVSRTRLSVRQLPTFASERALKKLALHAVRAFEDEVRAGARESLTADELAADVAPPDGDDAEDAPPDDGKSKKKPKWTKKGRPTAVKQAKVVHQTDRIDAVTGRPRSKGYGFLELHAHADALRVLRWANNNAALAPLLEGWWRDEVQAMLDAELKKPEGDGEGARDEARVKKMREELVNTGRKAKSTLIVEFSIENVQVVQRRAAKQKEAREAVRVRLLPSFSSSDQSLCLACCSQRTATQARSYQARAC